MSRAAVDRVRLTVKLAVEECKDDRREYTPVFWRMMHGRPTLMAMILGGKKHGK